MTYKSIFWWLILGFDFIGLNITHWPTIVLLFYFIIYLHIFSFYIGNLILPPSTSPDPLSPIKPPFTPTKGVMLPLGSQESLAYQIKARPSLLLPQQGWESYPTIGSVFQKAPRISPGPPARISHNRSGKPNRQLTRTSRGHGLWTDSGDTFMALN